MAAEVEGHINYAILVKFDSSDGSTYFGHKYYNNLVNSDSSDGSTYWTTYIL